MGFFSSRKPDDDYPGHRDEKSVVAVIRSRFYGKHNKAKESQTVPSFIPQAPSVAQAPSANSKASRHLQARSLPNTPPKPKSSAPSQPSPLAKSIKLPPPPEPRKPTDTVTMSLAQRLNELASANSEGLLSDDEYRVLRQNLFERFTGSSVVPAEAPVVPVTLGAKSSSLRNKRASSSVASNFVVQVPRSPSLSSKKSNSSLMDNIFRRGSTRRGPSRDYSDTSSVFSAASTTSNMFRMPRVLSKKSSNSSIQTDASRQADSLSISSRQRSTNNDATSPRSVTSRRFATPPSSFPTRSLGHENKPNSVQNIFDEDNLKTSHEIRQEIAAVEAEGGRLLDAFNGLELTTLSNRRRRHGRTVTDEGEASTWTLVPDAKRRFDSDAISMRSGISNGTSPSITRSAYSSSNRNIQRSKSNVSMLANTKPSSLHRKNSTSSVSSGKGALSPRPLPPVPPLPRVALGHMDNGSLSSVNLARSTGHLPMRSVPEDEVHSITTRTMDIDEMEYEEEMEDIRRRREELSLQYAARLDYLRAKLKGAQLHEKLMKK
ncbi:hypothetical protein C8J56DRAFT_818345 [Mycena floridula]|nr:hypothetical protein C8J56DRAFT_818345 [Mycena floridula]